MCTVHFLWCLTKNGWISSHGRKRGIWCCVAILQIWLCVCVSPRNFRSACCCCWQNEKICMKPYNMRKSPNDCQAVVVLYFHLAAICSYLRVCVWSNLCEAISFMPVNTPRRLLKCWCSNLKHKLDRSCAQHISWLHILQMWNCFFFFMF